MHIHLLRAYFGWPAGPRLEELRNAWLAAPDAAARKTIREEIQRQAFIDLPMIPLGQYFQPTVYRKSLTDVVSGFATYWNVRRSKGKASHSAAVWPRPPPRPRTSAAMPPPCHAGWRCRARIG